MIFGPAEDQNSMQTWCEERDQKLNNDLVFATERKMWRMPIFPPSFFKEAQMINTHSGHADEGSEQGDMV